MNKQKGITLIALVITIIVLLILAGVAISALSGNDSIINNAGTAVDEYNEKALAEEAVLNTLEKKLIEYSNGGGTGTDTPTEPEPPTPPSVDENGLATAPYTIYPDATNNPNLQIVIPTGFAPAILTGSRSTTSLPGQDGSVASIMPANQWSSITATQIRQGIVVVDHAITYTETEPDFNEYVWVPITGRGRNKFARCDWTTPKGADSDGSWGDGGRRHLLAETSTANHWWDDTTTDEYTNMVTSVARNKGFYISRYEASYDSTATMAQSKRGYYYPWLDITQNDNSGIGAIQASANANPTVHTHLMYGIEWDSTLNWLIENAIISSSTVGQTKTMDIDDIQSNSNTWGNYFDSTGDAAKEPYLQSAFQTTGASEYWKANNIYDLAGNVYEWTQEKWSTGSLRYVAYRGGTYTDRGANDPVATRYYDDESNSNDIQRFPLQLLLVALNSGSDAQGK